MSKSPTDAQIEDRARELCREQGMDPDFPIDYGPDTPGFRTPSEQRMANALAAVNGAPGQSAMLHGKLWMKFRHDAAVALG